MADDQSYYDYLNPYTDWQYGSAGSTWLMAPPHYGYTPEIVGASYPVLDPGEPEGFRRGSKGRVPRTKRYKLHKGEGVIPRREMDRLPPDVAMDLTSDDSVPLRRLGRRV